MLDPLDGLLMSSELLSLPMPGIEPSESTQKGISAAEVRSPELHTLNSWCTLVELLPVNPPTRWKCGPRAAPAVLSTPVGASVTCAPWLQVFVAGSKICVRAVGCPPPTYNLPPTTATAPSAPPLATMAPSRPPPA